MFSLFLWCGPIHNVSFFGLVSFPSDIPIRRSPRTWRQTHVCKDRPIIGQNRQGAEQSGHILRRYAKHSTMLTETHSASRATVAQNVEWTVQEPKGWWFKSRSHLCPLVISIIKSYFHACYYYYYIGGPLPILGSVPTADCENTYSFVCMRVRAASCIKSHQLVFKSNLLKWVLFLLRIQPALI